MLTDEIDVMAIWEENNEKPLYISDDDLVEEMYFKDD